MNTTSAQKRNNSPDEAAMAQLAANNLKHADKGVVPGKKLPDGFVNPEQGTREHLCLDRQGKYRPDWMQLFLIKGDQMGRRQYVAGWTVEVGRWVDVPDFVANAIENCVVEEVEMNPDTALRQGHDATPQVINKIPRFNYRVLPSA